MATEFKPTLREALRRLTPKGTNATVKRTLGLAGCALSVALLALGLTTVMSPQDIKASDHDDGDIDVRSRALSLTDLYAFREVDQNSSARADDIILVMNTNPRSLARVQYYFSSQARYEFRISRVSNVNGVPTAVPDLTLRLTFNTPDMRLRQQRATLSVIERGGTTTTVSRTTNNTAIRTTPLSNAARPVLNQVRVRNSNITVFAGLREDPFFFDVEQFFRVRAGALGTGPAVGFRTPETAVDFTTGYNVNTIAIRIPRRLLQGSTNATSFDVWLSLMVQDPATGQFFQAEQLARPAVNEGLMISQRGYQIYNRSMPTRAANNSTNFVLGEAARTLSALGNSNERIGALAGAFFPDVMRIDTTGPSGYLNAVNRRGAPIRGRLLTDDVIDGTLSVLTNGAVTADNVSYEGTPGNPAQGHDPLQPTFPYLALPN